MSLLKKVVTLQTGWLSALLLFAISGGEKVYSQTLVVNKYVCSAGSFTSTPPSGDAINSTVNPQCQTITSAQVGEDVVYFVVITNLKPPTTGITLNDMLPTYFVVKDAICQGYSGGSCGPPPTLSGTTLTWSGLTVPVDDGTTPQRSVVIEVRGYFTRSGNDGAFTNTATGTPHTPPANGDPNTNVAPKPMVVDAGNPKWDLGVEKTMVPNGSNGFHVILTVKNNSADKVYVDRLLYLVDRLNVMTSPIPVVKYTLSNFVCSPNSQDPGCPSLPNVSTTGLINTGNQANYLAFLQWQGPPLQPAYLSANSSIKIEFDITFESVCGRGDLQFTNEAFLSLQQTNTTPISDSNNTNDHPFVPPCPAGTAPCPTLTWSYSAPACPTGNKAVVSPSNVTSVQWWNGTNDEVVYRITIVNGSSNTFELKDEITKIVGTPPFQWDISTPPACTPATACGSPSTLNLTGIAVDTQPKHLFTLPVTGSATVTFGIRFTPLERCQTTTGNRIIRNTAIVSTQSIAIERWPVDIQMAELPKCQLTVTKDFSGQYTGVMFGVPISYKVTYANNSATQSVNIRTLIDAVSITSVYGNGILVDVDPISKCTASWGPNFALSSTTAVYQTDGWRGNPILNLANAISPLTFPPNGSISCDITITPQAPSSCESSANAIFVNAAFIDTEVYPTFSSVRPPHYDDEPLPLPSCRTITIQKTTDNNIATPGASRTFTITVHNAGGATATGITLQDPMPSGFTIQSATCRVMPGNTACTSQLTWNTNQILSGALDPIPANGDIVITVVVIAPAVGGSYRNVAEIDFTNQGNAHNSGGNKSNPAQVQVQTPVLEKKFEPGTAKPGDQVALVFTISNPTGKPVNEIRFTDNLPSGLQVVSLDQGGTNCVGNIQAVPGSSSITLTGGTVQNASCQIRVVVLVTGCSVVNQWSPEPDRSNIINVNNLDPTGVKAELLVSPCPPPVGHVQICKVSSATNPVSGTFNFTVVPTSGSSVPVNVPVGGCSAAIPVAPGNAIVTETLVAGTGVTSISASGYDAVTGSQEDRLVSTNTLTRTATVKIVAGDVSTATMVRVTNGTVPMGYIEVCKSAAPGASISGSFSFTVEGASGNPYTVPSGACSGPIKVQSGAVTVTEAPRGGFQLIDVGTIPSDRVISENIPGGSATVMVPGGDLSTQTVVQFFNGTGPGQLKLCKIAGPGVTEGQTFTISANGVASSVPAGPAASGGYCVLDGTFPAGTVVTVQESIPTGGQVSGIAVNPPDRAVGTPDLTKGTAQLTIGSGFTEVTFTNTTPLPPPSGQLTICKVAGPGVSVGTNFTFTIRDGVGSTQRHTLQAGPAPQGGYCVVDRTFSIGAMVTVSELSQVGTVVTGIKVEPPSRAGEVSIPNRSAVVTIGSGLNVVTFTNSGPLTITTSALMPVDGERTNVTGLSASGGVPPYRWQVVGDSLPTGARLDADTGQIFGMDAVTRSGPFVVEVMDSSLPPQKSKAAFERVHVFGLAGATVEKRAGSMIGTHIRVR